jgi:phage terminase large subunit-like protein
MALTFSEEKDLIRLLEDEKKEKARNRHIKFMDYTWRKKDPFIHGFHTEKICERIGQAFEDFRNGKSTYLLINVHHRSGKTDMVSRYLGAHFLGEFPDKEVMQVSYSAEKAEGFAAFGRNVFKSDKYAKLYPEVGLSTETNKKSEWHITDQDRQATGGQLFASGLRSGLTGSGFHLGILDDYCSGRTEAESEKQRGNAWDCFSNDFMTRAAPVSIVIVLATQWHWDDISGRIIEEMKDNPNFPRFERMTFPARAGDYTGPGEYPGEFLFLERFPKQWYLAQYATLGPYSAAALLDCDAHPRTGGILSTDGVIVHDDIIFDFPSLTDCRWWRIWDLAHTAKERQKDDPDFTSGTLLAFRKEPGSPVPHLYIRDVKRCRKGATERDSFMRVIAKMDGHFVHQAIEHTLDSKDAYHYIRKTLPEISWTKIQVKGDKMIRATPLEPIFACPGHVHIALGDWNDAWLNEVIKFDGLGKHHDDQVDNMSAGYQQLMGGMKVSDKAREAMRKRRKRA